MSKDANELAAAAARAEEREARLQEVEGGLRAARAQPVRGTLNIWPHGDLDMDPHWASDDVSIDLRVQPGAIVSYERGGSAEIFFLGPGAYASFVPDDQE